MTRYQFDERRRSKHRRLLECIATGNENEERQVRAEMRDLAREYRGMR